MMFEIAHVRSADFSELVRSRRSPDRSHNPLRIAFILALFEAMASREKMGVTS